MIRDVLAEKVNQAVAALVESGQLPAAAYGLPEISDTKQPEHGDYACNFAMVASKKAGMPPRAVGEAIREMLLSQNTDGAFEAIEIAGPGFINFRLSPAFQSAFLREVHAHQERWASSTATANPLKINVEFVSVNPNGPITIGSGRGAAYGSTLCNVLEAAGHSVHREYYINDGVNSEQMRLFAESVRSVVLGQPIPENGYKGEYVHHVGQQVVELSRPYRLSLVRPLVFEIKRIRHHLNGGAHDHVSPFAQLVVPHVVEEQRLEHLFHEVTRAEALEHAIDFVQHLADQDAAEGRHDLESIRNIVRELPAHQLQAVVQEFMIRMQREALQAFGVTFDTWFSEQSLHDAGQVHVALEALHQGGVADSEPIRTKLKLGKGGKIEEVEREPQTSDVDDEGNAIQVDANEGETLWLRSTKFGDDMDRVLRRRDGRLTYIASDVAYHQDKFNRPANADKLITILGPDHHGYIGRLQAVVGAMLLAQGAVSTASSESQPMQETDLALYPSAEERDRCQAALALAREKLEVQIYQLVRFMKDGQPAPMRKRDGNIYALIDLMDEIGQTLRPEESIESQREVGRDVARFFYLMRSHDTTFDFDLDLAQRQSDENPVFYVQYAHARICSILERAKTEIPNASMQDADLGLLTHERELALVRKILDLPWEVKRCADDYAVHRLVTYAIELARAFHYFYDACRVIQSDELPLSQARLSLCEATALTLRSTLELLGVSAPRKMER